MLSNRYWMRRLGGDPAIVGKRVEFIAGAGLPALEVALLQGVTGTIVYLPPAAPHVSRRWTRFATTERARFVHRSRGRDSSPIVATAASDTARRSVWRNESLGTGSD